MVTKEELTPFKPVAKFLVVKSVVFFTYWQSVLLAILVHIGVLNNTTNFSVGEVQIGLQDFAVCIEMFIAAAVHKYTFGIESYLDGTLLALMENSKVEITGEKNEDDVGRIIVVGGGNEGEPVRKKTLQEIAKEDEEEGEGGWILFDELDSRFVAELDEKQKNHKEDNPIAEAVREAHKDLKDFNPWATIK